jgi:hypothetical protein
MSESSQGGKFDSTIGGAALRLGEGPDSLGVLDAPNTPCRSGWRSGPCGRRARRFVLVEE